MAATKLKSTWYKPSTGHRLRTPDEIGVLEREYIGWWETKNDKLWRDRPVYEVKSDMARSTIFRESKFVGEIEIRSISASHMFPYVPAIYDKGGEVKSVGLTAPAHYAVIWKGKRVDSFLSSKRAKECALQLAGIA